jgi:hypothetical protein
MSQAHHTEQNPSMGDGQNAEYLKINSRVTSGVAWLFFFRGRRSKDDKKVS